MKKLYLLMITILMCGTICSCSDDDNGGDIPENVFGTWYGEEMISAIGSLRTVTLSLYEDRTGQFIYTSKVYYRVAEFSFKMNGNTIICDGVIVGEDGVANPFNQRFQYRESSVVPIDMYNEFTLTK